MRKTTLKAATTKIADYRPATWQVIVITGLLGIATYRLTGSTSIGELLLLLLLIYLSIKAAFFALRVGSFLLKVLLVIFILLAWLGTFLAQSTTFK